ncbi:MAG: hypothetical protein OER56_11935, partial [Hyphomicrobiales bacterium]|nr:hypothetical protein [Hyphomicrobiales bacterium]
CDHLAKNEPVPVHFTSHSSSKDDRVKVSSRAKQALVYSTQEFMIISLPMTPIEKNRAKRRSRAR